MEKPKILGEKPIILGLDLFCGAGGGAVGYAKALEAAGYRVEILGIDHKSPKVMREYPYYFVQDDVIDFMERTPLEWFEQFDFIHASPPCQYSSRTRHLAEAQGNLPSDINLMPETKAFLRPLGIPYVIENVVEAWRCGPCEYNPQSGCKACREVRYNPPPERYQTILCGSSFDLGVQRHRLFETSFPVSRPPCDHNTEHWPISPDTGKPKPIGVYGSPNDWVKGNSKKNPEKGIIKGGWTAKSTEAAMEAMGIEHITVWERLKHAIPPAYTEHVGKCFIEWKKTQIPTEKKAKIKMPTAHGEDND